MMYYIIINNEQHGPFSKEELRLRGISPDTMVWREGMTGWEKASSVRDLADLFGGAVPPPPFNPSYPGNYGYPGMAPDFNGEPIPHTNWQPWAVIATVCGVLFNCLALILAIIGLVNANKANRYYSEGWADRGASANSTAKIMTIIALALEVISLVYFATNWQSIIENYSGLLSL